MKIKTALGILLAAAMLTAGCGGSEAPAESSAAQQTEEGSAEIQVNEDTNESGADNAAAEARTEENGQDENSAEPEATGQEQDTGEEADFSQVIVNDDNLKFEITGIGQDSIWGYTWKVTAENKTDQPVLVSMDNVSVNGVMCDPFWATEIAAGKIANQEVSWSEDSFSQNGISEVSQVTFILRMVNSDDFTTYHEQEYTVYPEGEEAAEEVSREKQSTDEVLFDNEQCAMTVTGIDPDGDWGYTVRVYLENKTDEQLTFSCEDVSVNGIMCDPFWATEVAAGKTGNSEISWSEELFKENGIDEVEAIELPVHVRSTDNWEADDIVKDTFTIKP